MSSSKINFLHKVSVVMGSDSDLPIMKSAVEILEEFGISSDVCILSAHRTPIEMMEYAKNASENNIEIIIAGAGGSAHLPGMIASLTLIPTIGVPIKSQNLSGIDSLLSIVQMPKGIPVATVAINGGQNAGLLAAQIIGISDNIVKNRLRAFRQEMHSEVRKKNKNLKIKGIKTYLEEN